MGLCEISDCNRGAFKISIGDGFDIQRGPSHQTVNFEFSDDCDRTGSPSPVASSSPDNSPTQAGVWRLSELFIPERQAVSDQFGPGSI